MSCEVCEYWEWRLKDLRLSRDKRNADLLMSANKSCTIQPMQGIYEDISRVRKAIHAHDDTHLFERPA